MPPNVAVLLALSLTVYLFLHDRRVHPRTTAAVWVPLLWVTIISSRYVSTWLGGSVTMSSTEEYLDGSPLDRAVFLGLIAIGVLILMARRTEIVRILSENPVMVVFLAYCLVSIVWSDYSWVAFKRWIKVLGHPVMVLVLLTEPEPYQSMKSMFRRCASFLVPMSIVFIKYFPGLGRGFDDWTGEAVNLGVTTNKNTLGSHLLILALFVVWALLARKEEEGFKRRGIWVNDTLVSLGMLAGMLWLFRLADSATSLVCFMLGSAILVALHSKTLKLEQQPIGLLIVSGVIMLGLMQLIFGLSDLVIGAVGRETTLTGRTALWADVLGMVQSPLFGTGFESFWVGPEAQVLWDKYWWHPNQAHNGYLETYINLGIVGVGLLAIVLFATYRSARAAYARATPMASLWLAYLFVIIVYNWTEASFKALHLLFFVFFLISVRYIQPVSSEIQVEEEVPSWDRRQRRLAARRPVAARRPKGVPRWDEPVAVDPLSK